MTNPSESPPRKLVLFTLLILLMMSTALYLYIPSLAKPVVIDTNGQPTLGSDEASVHIVAFEEPLCGDCRRYQHEIFPYLDEEFIKRGKAQYTLIPLSFLSGSLPTCVALLCIYTQGLERSNPSLFFTYLEYLSQQPVEELKSSERLIVFAQETSPDIDLSLLKTSLEKEEYRKVIENNTKYAKQVMGKGAVTPTVYVNGMKVEHLTLENVRKAVYHSLERK